MPKFKISTLGCKVNQYDSMTLKRKLLALGFEHDTENPGLVVVNTCAVTKTAIKKSRRKFKELKKNHPKARFVLAGCWPKTYQHDAQRIGADLAWGTSNQEGLAEEILKLLDVSTSVSTCVLTDVCDSIDPPRSGVRSRYFIKIQDGCEQFCSYCIIPYSRGKLSSRPEKDVLSEIKSAIDAGFREVVLCGIHLGLYGQEKDSKTCNLAQLLGQITKIKNLGRVRLSSIEINDVSDELVEIMEKNRKICKHLHIPLQSGSDKILKLMNRPYDTRYFSQKVLGIRNMVPDIALTTDVIVGFPGETEREFQETCDCIKQVGFSRIHAFPFSAHEKTLACNLPDQVPEIEKKQRAALLRQKARKLQLSYRRKFEGTKEMIVVEKIEGEFVCGIGEHYFQVQAKIHVTTKSLPRIGSLFLADL